MSVRRIIGSSPGTLIHIGEQKTDAARISVIDYDPTSLRELEVDDVKECFQFRETATVTWINVDGLHQVKVIEELGRNFNIHPLTQEDVLHTHQRPKLEEYDEYLFIVLRMLSGSDGFQDEQLSIVLGANFVFSFQERVGDVLDPLRERIRSGKGRIRKMGADYLAYALVDLLVDHYFLVLEKLGDEIEKLEGVVVTDPTPTTMAQLYEMRSRLILMRKSVWPLREVISRMERLESPLIKKGTAVFLRDVYDHTIQVIDTVETFRDMSSSMLDLYLSSVSNRTNEVMKVLTIIGSVFIPLTFVAGVYGMNFDHMPELRTRYGYFAVLFLMALIAGCMFSFFKRRKWI